MPPLRFTTRSGTSLYVEEHGRGQPVLAIHGLGGGAWFFSGLGRRLADDYRVIAIDLPGTGRSTCRGPLSLETWTADLRDLVADHIAEPVVLLGHSMGTIVGLLASAAWPEHLRALIFTGGLPEPRPLMKERLASRAECASRDGLVGLGVQVAEANFARATLTGQPELVGLFARAFEAQDAAIYVQWCRLLIASSAWAVVGEVRVPCLAITGEEDQYAPPALVADFMRQLSPRREAVVLPGCGHLAFLEAPAAFAAAVTSFLATVC